MAVPTLIASLLLIVVGIVSYVNGTPGDDGKVSPTALIPAFVGAVLAVCGLLAFNDKFRKHAMHAAAALATLGVLGVAVMVIKGIVRLAQGEALARPLAFWMQTIMLLILVIFVALCVRSFIEARRARTVFSTRRAAHSRRS